jgi:hypothetical protein
MTIIVQDSFNRADSASLGTAETGQTWVYSNKPYGIRSNQAYLHLNGTTSFDSVAYIDSGISDGKITWTIATYQASNSRLIFRYVDFGNHLAIEPRANDIRIYKRVANTTTTVGTFPHSSASGDVISVELTGSTVKVSVNGTLKTTVTIAELITATKHGMFANNTEVVRYDDFIVEDFNTGDTGTTGSISYSTKNVIYRTASNNYDSKQQLYQSLISAVITKQSINKTSSNSYDTLIDIYNTSVTKIDNFSLKVQIYKQESNNYSLIQRLFKEVTEVKASVHNHIFVEGISTVDTKQIVMKLDSVHHTLKQAFYVSNQTHYDTLQQLLSDWNEYRQVVEFILSITTKKNESIEITQRKNFNLNI